MRADGAVVLFDGWLDNRCDLARRLDMPPGSSAAEVYGAACLHWSERADNEAIGSFSALIADSGKRELRLSRSPLEAPPLQFCHLTHGIAAGSLPGVLFALGLERRFDPKALADALYMNGTGGEGMFRGVMRLRVGEVAHLSAHGSRHTATFDPFAARPLSRASLPELVREADRLLVDAAGSVMGNGDRVGVLLTGGLDSSNVAARALRFVPDGGALHSFTFTSPDGAPQPDPRRWCAGRGAICCLVRVSATRPSAVKRPGPFLNTSARSAGGSCTSF